jgi:hypothetical protein
MKQLLLNIQKFAKEKFETDFEKLFEKHKTDDGYDFAGIKEEIKIDLDKYNSARQPNIDELKTKHKTEFETDFFKGLEIDGVTNQEQFKTHVDTIKNSTDANAKEVTRLTGELDTKAKEFETMETDYTKSKTESAKMAFKLDIIDEEFSSRFENAVKGEFETMTKDLKEFDKKDIFKQIGEKFPEYKNDFVSGTDNFGNRKPNDNKKHTFGGKKDDKGFYGGKV